MSQVKRREIFGWAFFDFANSSYTTVVITAIYSGFFVTTIVPQDSPVKDSYWSIAMIIATLLTIVLSPLAGAICDLSAKKKKYLLMSAMACSFFTALLWIPGPGDVWLAIAAIALSQFAFNLSESFCASFLPEIASKKDMGRISGFGWAIGYFGGLSSLILVKLIVTAQPESDAALFVAQNQWAMFATALFFLVGSIPTFLFLTERAKPKPGFENASMKVLFKAGFSQLSNTTRLWKSNRVLFQFFLAFMVYMAGLDVVIRFVGIYTRSELQMTSGDLTVLFLILQLSAAAGAFLFGLFESKLGAKRTVLLTLIWWMAGILGIIMIPRLILITGYDAKQIFFVLSFMAGAGLGATQSSSRALVGHLAPPQQSAEVFGLWGMFMRLATLLGTMFGFLSDALGSRHQALWLVMGFFFIGFVLLSAVKIPHSASHR